MPTPVIVVAPDSFKGSLTAPQAAEAIKAGVLRACPDAEVRVCPMADGGEGTLDVLLSRGGSRLNRSIKDASRVPRSTPLGVFPAGEGLVEVAQIVGLTDHQATRTPVQHRTSAGVGEAVLQLLDHGCERIYLALGGSSTNDGGFGMLAALGVRFLDEHGIAILPVPSSLERVHRVEVAALDPRLRAARLTALSDVNNPLFGPDGATFVFGPQKGVQPIEASSIDAEIARVATLVEAALGRNAAKSPGAGAAGGLGFGVQVLCGESLSGAATIANLLGYESAMQGAALILTGEGRSDAQTLHGKAPLWVAEQAAKSNTPAVLISGAIDPPALAQLNQHFARCFAIVSATVTVDEAINHAATHLESRAEQAARFFFARR